MIVYYKNAWGTTFELGDGAVSSSDDLKGWSWRTSSVNGKSRYDREAREASSYITFYGQDAARLAEEFFTLCDLDTANNLKGTFAIGDWSLACNIITGELETQTDSYRTYRVTVRSDNPVWRKTREWSIPPESLSVSDGLNYPHDYPFDFTASPIGQKTLINDALYQSDFMLIVYGPVTNPSIDLNGNTYRVDCVVPDGGVLFINSLNKGVSGAAIFLRGVDGTITNMFSKRKRGAVGSGDYIFEPLSAGNLSVTWSGAFGFDLYTYEGRSVLPWT